MHTFHIQIRAILFLVAIQILAFYCLKLFLLTAFQQEKVLAELWAVVADVLPKYWPPDGNELRQPRLTKLYRLARERGAELGVQEIVGGSGGGLRAHGRPDVHDVGVTALAVPDPKQHIAKKDVNKWMARKISI